MLRRLLVLVLCCSCAPASVQRSGHAEDDADAAADTDAVAVERTSADAGAVASVNASTATGMRTCPGGLYVVYSQPQRTKLVPSNGNTPARYEVSITNDTAESVSLWTQDSMNCPTVTLFPGPSCGFSATGGPQYCNSGEWLACAIYRKPAGEASWHLSRSGTVDFNQATYDPAAGAYRFNFVASTWSADGPNGCPGDTSQATSYAFR